MKPYISTRNLHKIYVMGDEKIRALDGVSMDIARGERVCVLGTSGSGKSTLLNMLAGLEKPSKGEIIFGDIHLEKLSEALLTRFRSLNIGFVFQSYNLIPTLNALENVALGLTFKGIPKKQRNEMATEMLVHVGLGDRLKHKPKELSGGQQQRVSIARAFVGNPRIVFADEPTGNLDTRTSVDVMNVITKLADRHNQTLIIVTHDEEITRYADRTFHMRDGKLDRIIQNERREVFVTARGAYELGNDENNAAEPGVPAATEALTATQALTATETPAVTVAPAETAVEGRPVPDARGSAGPNDILAAPPPESPEKKLVEQEPVEHEVLKTENREMEQIEELATAASAEAQADPAAESEEKR